MQGDRDRVELVIIFPTHSDGDQKFLANTECDSQSIQHIHSTYLQQQQSSKPALILRSNIGIEPVLRVFIACRLLTLSLCISCVCKSYSINLRFWKHQNVQNFFRVNILVYNSGSKPTHAVVSNSMVTALTSLTSRALDSPLASFLGRHIRACRKQPFPTIGTSLIYSTVLNRISGTLCCLKHTCTWSNRYMYLSMGYLVNCEYINVHKCQEL